MAVATMKHCVEQFFEHVGREEIEIYNEFSLQHELGIYLRNIFKESSIEFERNVTHFGFEKSKLIKKEIDLSIYSKSKMNLDCVIELKYPRNGQVPEQMYNFCKDIAFLEQLKKAGFKNAYFIAVADDKLFYSGNSKGIYGLFRDQQTITGNIQKPTGSKDTDLTIQGSYTAKWQNIMDTTKFCFVEISV